MKKTAQKYVIANWKMNGLQASLHEIRVLSEMLRGVHLSCLVTLCPPLTLLPHVAKLVRPGFIEIGAQNCHHEEKGAFTGEVSAPMLKECGVWGVIVGHSERRTLFAETSKMVGLKADSVRRSEMTAIVCVGETYEDYTQGRTEHVVCEQLQAACSHLTSSKNTIIAYEPVWAIGSGKTPSSEEIVRVHAVLRDAFHRTGAAQEERDVSVLYGGSLTPHNAAEILHLPGVDGGLVGGASLQAATFLGVLKPYME